MNSPAAAVGVASPQDAARIAEAIAQRGYVRLADVVDDDWLAAIRAYAMGPAITGHEMMWREHQLADAPGVRAIANDPALREYLDAVARCLHPTADPTDRTIAVGIRVIDGQDPEGRPLWFHYDATVLTVVVPIEIPDAEPGQCGELVMYPNRRPFRRAAWVNVLEKSFAQSDVFRRRHSRRSCPTFDVITLRPGDAYVFSGYRSYHATLPVPPGVRRVTMLLHYRDVHAGSRLVEVAKAFRRQLDRRAT